VVAIKVRILFVCLWEVLDSAGSGTASQLISGLQRAYNHFVNGLNNPGARTWANQFSDVTNLPIGFSGRVQTVEDFIVAVFSHSSSGTDTKIANEGMTVVAAGNSASDVCTLTPAAGPGVITGKLEWKR
jgi:hypothetical protein